MEDLELAVEAGAPLAVGEFFTQLLRERRDGGLPADPQQAFAAGAALILQLKAVHRRLCESTDALREAAAEAKSQLDQSSLQLQNLLYERQHYEKEIASCRGWRSAYSDEQIGLVPVEQFASLAGPLAEESDPHQLMLNRLAHEVAYRKEHMKQLDGVRARRDALAADVAQKRGAVAGLEAEIGKLLASAQAVQQQYGIKLPPATAEGPPAAGGAGTAAAAEAAAAAGNGGAVEQQEQEQQQEAAAGGDAVMQDAGPV